MQARKTQPPRPDRKPGSRPGEHMTMNERIGWNDLIKRTEAKLAKKEAKKK